jgi:ABC-type nitrate/sulfonate/bicarbonate transport system substrate-binding protein
MDRLMERIHETNRWMNQHRTQEHFQEMGKKMAEAGERIRDMLHRTDRLYTEDLNQDRDRDRIKDIDRLRDRLHDMERDLDRTHDALQQAIDKQ